MTRGRRLAGSFLRQPVDLTTELEGVRVVDDPVDDRSRHLVFCEELAPVGKVLVRGQHDRAVLVEAVHELEEVLARLPAHGQVAELIDDQQIEPAELSKLSFELAFHLRGLKLLDELECSAKRCLIARSGVLLHHHGRFR